MGFKTRDHTSTDKLVAFIEGVGKSEISAPEICEAIGLYGNRKQRKLKARMEDLGWEGFNMGRGVYGFRRLVK